MTKLLYHKQNFFKNTYCIFKAVALQTLDHKKPDFVSRSGSEYYYTDEGVYRKSTHWGRAATCKWRLQIEASNFRNGKKIGFATWTSFYPDNDVEKLYFIKKSEFSHKYEYFHKNEPLYKPEYILRTSGETRKVLRQIKTITNEQQWAKYIPHDNIDELRNFLIQGLVTSNKTLSVLKRMYNE